MGVASQERKKNEDSTEKLELYCAQIYYKTGNDWKGTQLEGFHLFPLKTTLTQPFIVS